MPDPLFEPAQDKSWALLPAEETRARKATEAGALVLDPTQPNTALQTDERHATFAAESKLTRAPLAAEHQNR